jgi:hypothetical protein
MGVPGMRYAKSFIPVICWLCTFVADQFGTNAAVRTDFSLRTPYSITLPNISPDRRQELESMLPTLDARVQSDPANPDAYCARAVVFLELGKWNLAISDAGKAIRLDPQSSKAHACLGTALAVMGEHELAVPELAKSIDLGADKSTTYKMLAMCRIGLRDFDGAHRDLDAAIATANDEKLLDEKLLSLPGVLSRNFSRFSFSPGGNDRQTISRCRTAMTDTTIQARVHGDRCTRWLLIAIGIYSGLLVSLLNVHILSSGSTQERAIILMADGLILFWIIIGGSLTPWLRRWLVPRLTAIPIGWRLRFVLLCTAMALLEEVITTSMTNLAPLLGTTPEEAHITASTNYFVVVCFHSVVVFVPMFAAWAWMLSRWDFSPLKVLLLFGITGSIAEASMNPPI